MHLILPTYLDRNGIAFSDYRLHLPAQVWQFPKPSRMDERNCYKDFHAEFQECWQCGKTASELAMDGSKLEAHHGVAQARRANSRVYLVMICRECHMCMSSNAVCVGRCLYLKWKHDPAWLDFVQWALTYRRFLPDLIGD